MKVRLERKLLSSAGKFLIVCLVTLGLLEATLRVYHYVRPSFVFPDSSYNRWRGKPFAKAWDFSLNHAGFMGAEFTVQKPDGVFRIIALGDSFAFGVVPYHLNSLTILEEELNQESGKPRFEVINMGISGIGPKEYLSLLVKEGMVLSPDMVIVYFFVGNDFTNSESSTGFDEHLYTGCLAKYLWSLFQFGPGTIYRGVDGSARAAAYDDGQPSYPHDLFVEIEAGASSIYVTGKSVPWSRYLGLSVSYLSKIKKVCASKGVPLLVVLCPDQVQFDKKLQKEVVQWLIEHRWSDLKEDDLDFLRPNRELKKRLEGGGVQCFDLLQAFSIAARTEKVYRPCDTHWNQRGNKLAAQTLRKYLGEQRLILHNKELSR